METTLDMIATSFLLLFPLVVMGMVTFMNRDIKRLEETYIMNQFEAKDILRDIKANTVRIREILIDKNGPINLDNDR